jgi:site-specific recombinase XerD
MRTILSTSDRERLLRKYRKYLSAMQGLAPRTCAGRLFYAREFLQTRLRSGRGKVQLRELTPEITLNYILERSAQDSSPRLQALASALRSFGRFLKFSGFIRDDYTSAVPRIASAGRSCLPDYLRLDQLERLLGSIKVTSASGLRNYALILCLARLGLRASEAAALTLDQIQWRTGVILLGAGKGRRERTLPLPRDVGAAIAKYLQHRKISADSRRVFCAIRNGKALGSMAISQMVRRALQQAEVQTPRPGAHLLRRTLASHLVQQGVSLKAVADLLGHRSLDTTRLYANVHHSMLLEVSRPWPTEVKR